MSGVVTQEFLDKNQNRIGKPALTEKDGQWVESKRVMMAGAFLFVTGTSYTTATPFVNLISACPITLKTSEPICVPLSLLSNEFANAFLEMVNSAPE